MYTYCTGTHVCTNERTRARARTHTHIDDQYTSKPEPKP